MRAFLISDSQDVLHGLRFAGIEGVYVTEKQAALDALHKCVADEEIAVVLITEKLKALCIHEVYEIMIERRVPLIVEIPAEGEASSAGRDMLDYIRDAMGLKT